MCVAAVLGDALRRGVAVLGGREGMPRSLGSVYAGSVTRFLGGSLRGVASRVMDTPGVKSFNNGVAVSRDGCTLLVSDLTGGSNAIHEYNAFDGSRRRVVGSKGDGPLQFVCPCQVCIAPDDFVFVADLLNNRVQVLTPTLDFHSFVGVGQLRGPSGVCANADVVVVAEYVAHRISVFNRRDGTLVRQFGRDGSDGSEDVQLRSPYGLCFMPGDRHVAVGDRGKRRVSVFSVDRDGEFIRPVGVGILDGPIGVACSAYDELVVADSRRGRIFVFSDAGELLMTFGDGGFRGVVVHGSTVFAHDSEACQCVVWS
jgi:DNA-binding beta-propeller fold protein YncE